MYFRNKNEIKRVNRKITEIENQSKMFFYQYVYFNNFWNTM